MVHLSNKPLNKDKLLKLYQLFFEIINKTQNNDNFLELIKDILSPYEQIMVAKRIAIIYLLIKGHEQIAIAQYLRVSRATVSKFCLLFYEKESRIIKIIKSILRKEKIKKFLEDLFADILIQPGIKIGHWEAYWNHKRRQKEREMIDV